MMLINGLHRIDYPMRALGRPTKEVATIMCDIAKQSTVVISTQPHFALDGLHIRVLVEGQRPVYRVATNESEIQEELLTALVTLQLEK